MTRLGYFVALLSLGLPCFGADHSASVSGYVHDKGGAPQMGAAVEVLGSALQSVRVFTDEHGFFTAHGLTPGSYSVKVSAPAFLPSLREKVALRGGANVLLNVTLSTIFDAIQFAPRTATDDGDWNWVLRSTANRPVLRILSDGSPVVMAKNTQSQPDVRGSLSFVAGSPSQGFGSLSDMSTDFVVEKSLFASDTIRFNGDLGYGEGVPNAVVRTTFRHQMGNGSTPEVSFTMRRLASPELGLRNADLQALALSTSDTMTVGDLLEVKVGSEMQTIQFMGRVTAFRPFGSISAHLSPDTVVSYAYSTSRPDSRTEKGFDSAPADLSEADPRVSMSGYSPAVEKAHHQEVAVSHREGKTSLQAAVYNDHVANPALTGVGEFSYLDGDVLPDLLSGTFTYQGRDLQSEGMRMVLERKLTDDISATVNYSYGGVLEMEGPEAKLDDARADTAMRYRHAIGAKVSGKMPCTKTHWMASYGWTNGHALTPVDMFNASAGQTDPFLSFFLRQPIPGTGALSSHMELLIEIRNLLAQGYVPVMAEDGQTVYLVQSARAVRGGVAFSF